MARKIMVIGSNSFSGSDFVDLLLEDRQNNVVGVSRSAEKSKLFLPYKRHAKPQFTFKRCDLNHDMPKLIKLLRQFKPEYIVNFAAQSEVGPSWDAPWDWFQTNTVSLAHFLNYLKDAKYLKRYVHISSPEVYGSCEGVVTEEAPVNPSTPYAVSKASADFLIKAYHKNFQLPVCFVRATNVYGAHQQLFKIVPRTVISIKSGKMLHLHGGGQAVKSYIHVRDISRGELAVMEQGNLGELYHFSPPQGIKIRDLVKMICSYMKVDFEKVTQDVAERLGQDKTYVIDSSKARAQLGWSPKISLDQGIQEVVDWIDNNWAAIKKLPFEYIHKP